MSAVTIGMPVHNGARYIERALTSLLAQTHTDIQIVVADNASADDTQVIVAGLSDPRLSYTRHPVNLGAFANFMGLLQEAETPYFMWAAHDDWWSPNYVEACLSVLSGGAGFASGRVVNCAMDETPIRPIKHTPRLDHLDAATRIRSFVSEPEALGKANLIYSVFDAGLLRRVADEKVFAEWAGDVATVAAALSYAPHAYAPGATLFKRANSPEEEAAMRHVASHGLALTEFGGSFPPNKLESYGNTLTRGMDKDELRNIVRATLRRRMWAIRLWELQQKGRNLRARFHRLASL